LFERYLKTTYEDIERVEVNGIKMKVYYYGENEIADPEFITKNANI